MEGQTEHVINGVSHHIYILFFSMEKFNQESAKAAQYYAFGVPVQYTSESPLLPLKPAPEKSEPGKSVHDGKSHMDRPSTQRTESRESVRNDQSHTGSSTKPEDSAARSESVRNDRSHTGSSKTTQSGQSSPPRHGKRGADRTPSSHKQPSEPGAVDKARTGRDAQRHTAGESSGPPSRKSARPSSPSATRSSGSSSSSRTSRSGSSHSRKDSTPASRPKSPVQIKEMPTLPSPQTPPSITPFQSTAVKTK